MTQIYRPLITVNGLTITDEHVEIVDNGKTFVLRAWTRSDDGKRIDSVYNGAYKVASLKNSNGEASIDLSRKA
jgi:hypothetical protein